MLVFKMAITIYLLTTMYFSFDTRILMKKLKQSTTF